MKLKISKVWLTKIALYVKLNLDNIERMDKPMKRKFGIIAFLLSAVLLVGCAGTEAVPTPEPTAVQDGKIRTVDDFLAAIEPGAEIVLAEGVFNLTEAESYGQNPENGNYRWEKMSDGYELVILNADGLKISGAGMDKTSIVTAPRYATVLVFNGGDNICLSDFSTGHTDGEKNSCSGSVVKLLRTKNTSIDSCEFFGCGTIGIYAMDCYDLKVADTVIKECNIEAVHLHGCRKVLFDNCNIYNCGEDGDAVLCFGDSRELGVYNSRIHDNVSKNFVNSSHSEIFLRGCQIKDNYFDTAMFSNEPDNVLVEGCGFENNWKNAWYDSETKALKADGTALSEEELENMELQHYEYSNEEEQNDFGYREISVKTVDELLAAIGPNRKIILDTEFLDLSTASDYANGGNEWYYWRSCFDGSELVVSGVDNLSIVGQGKENTTMVAVPRYANVLNFENCNELELVGFTLGHTDEGYCTGGVLHFDMSDDIYIEDCGMFGCGTIGIDAYNCAGFRVFKSDIYECTTVAFNFSGCSEVEFVDCRLWDLPPVMAYVDEPVTFNGEVLSKGMYTLEDGKVVRYKESYYDPGAAGRTGDFSIWCGKMANREVTMRVGESYNFFAGRNLENDVIPDEPVTWSASKEDVIKLELLEDTWGYFCEVSVLNSTAGGVELTAIRGDESATITIYCLP